jgi:hypothetical protein
MGFNGLQQHEIDEREANLHKMKNDFEAEISKLQAIHTQHKQEVTSTQEQILGSKGTI